MGFMRSTESIKAFPGLRLTRKVRTRGRGIVRKLPLIAFAVVIAVLTGQLVGGSFADLRNEWLKGVDPGFFKKIMESRFPMIYTTYNSGSAKLAFYREFNGIFNFLFNFEPSNPLTILNSFTPQMEKYYINKHLCQDGQDGITGSGDSGGNMVNGFGDAGAGSASGSDAASGADIGEGSGGYEIDSNNSNGGNGGSSNGGGSISDIGFIEEASSITYYEGDINKEQANKRLITYGRVKIQNETDINLTSADIERLLSEELALNVGRNGPKALIYHTHTTEGYLKNLDQLTKEDVSSWTDDTRYSVVRVGDELMRQLGKFSIGVLHNGTVHDKPEYKYSYQNSLATIIKYQKSYPSLGIFLDIHRDALRGVQKLRRVTAVDSKNAAQIMFVIGTDSRLNHSYWRFNLKFAIKLQDKLAEKYPDLVVPIYLSSNRYNQHVSVGTLIVEAGADGNTVSESVESMKYLAWAINEVVFK